MLILAIDTAHKMGSVSLARGEGGSCKVIETAAVDGGTFSAQLVPQIALLLQKHGFGKQDIAGFAAAVGPGSFTGLRIGLAAVKALAETLRKPIAAVSVLEAIAFSSSVASSDKQNLFAVMDAGRSEFYVGEYQRSGTELLRISENLYTQNELDAEIKSRLHAPLIVTPGAKAAELGSSLESGVELVPQPDSGVVALLGYRKLLSGTTVSVDELDANYVRRDENLFARQ